MLPEYVYSPQPPENDTLQQAHKRNAPRAVDKAVERAEPRRPGVADTGMQARADSATRRQTHNLQPRSRSRQRHGTRARLVRRAIVDEDHLRCDPGSKYIGQFWAGWSSAPSTSMQKMLVMTWLSARSVWGRWV